MSEGGGGTGSGAGRPLRRPAGRITREDLGGWLVKANPDLTDVTALAAQGYAEVGGWCVRRSYRTALAAAGDLVLLWVSGDGRRVPAGLHAVGEVTGPVRPEPGAPGGDEPGLRLPLRLRPLAAVVPRERLRADPGLAGLEVLRSPWGSNPSVLTTREVTALRAAGLLRPVGGQA